MPFIQVSVPQGTSAEAKKEISLSIHESLVQAFQIPQDDYFQVFREAAPSDLFFPASYMDIPHTSNLIYVHMTFRSGRTLEQKKELYRLVAEKISARTNILSNDVIIITQENETQNWSFGQGIGQYIK